MPVVKWSIDDVCDLVNELAHARRNHIPVTVVPFEMMPQEPDMQRLVNCITKLQALHNQEVEACHP